MESVSSASAAATNTINTASSRLADNFETFLSLLTTQLKNQDPLSPLDTNEFTQQLTQMTGVEQQLLTNQLLQQLISANSQGVGDAVGLIGKTVTADVDTAVLDNGQSSWRYELGSAAETITLEIADASGVVVWRGNAEAAAAGDHDFTWDGRNQSGRKLDDGGEYTLKVTASTAGGSAVDSNVFVQGVATGVQTIEGQTQVRIGKSAVPLSAVVSVAAG